jgi:hypothetical protein
MTARPPTNPLNVVCLYDGKDKKFFDQLKTSLAVLIRANTITVWDQDRILAGMDVEKETSSNLARAEMLLVLLSLDFIANDVLMQYAEAAVEAQRIPVVPIVVRHCETESTCFSKVALLPKSKNPVDYHPNIDLAWTEVAGELRELIEAVISEPQVAMSRAREAAERLQFIHQFRDIRSDFINRDTIREKVQRLLTSEGAGQRRFVNLWGAPGIGKSFLADDVAYRLTNSYPHAQIKVNLKGATGKPLMPIEIMSEVIRRFRADVRLRSEIEWVKQVYDNTLGPISALIVLDDAANTAQVLPCIPPEHCAMIVTSRGEIAIEGVTSITVDRLEEPDAHDMISRIAGDLPKEIVNEICSSTDRIPLKIRVEAGRYAGRR